MEITYFHNEFPKENLQEIFRRIHLQGKSQGNRFLAEFVSEATRAVKQEIALIDADLQQLFPPFETIFSWAEDKTLREGPLSGAVDGVLLIVAQVCMYLSSAEQEAHIGQFRQPTQLAALGVGLFSAASVALSANIADLPYYGAQAVRISFRLGVHVTAVSRQLEACGIANEESEPQSRSSWAYVITGVNPVEVQTELDAFNSASGAAPASKIFLSGISKTSVTMSGPPSKLTSIFQKSRMFRDATSIPLPVYGGLCHAAHIYGPRDVTTIVDGASLKKLATAASITPLLAPSTGAAYRASNGVELFECVVSELLTQAIQFDNVIASIVGGIDLTHLRESETPAVVLGCFGVSLPLRELEKTLQDASVETTIKIIAAPSDDVEDGTPRGTAQAKLAIVGMSCRLPGANDTQEFWELLQSGRDVSSKIPADRFDIATHFDPSGKDMNKTLTEYGCFIEEPGMFDAPFFNMSPREAMTVDPQMRLMLLTAYEALEKAGWNNSSPIKSERIGTYYGQAADDYREVNQGQDVGTYYIPGGCRAFGPGRLNYFFKFAGPSYSIDTACSSGLAAIQVACQALWSGDIDMAVTGGVNILTNPDGFTGLSKGHFLTKGHNACKTWDASADGYCRADGIGSLVIKRFEDAQEDNILGVILATGTNHSADAISITHPHAGHQADLSRQVLRQAGVNPLDVSYIELHGTGTQAGDYEEMQGILNVYAPNMSPRRRNDQPLHMGSSKANVGHGESVAGTTALIKVLLMLQKNAIPPHVGIKTEMNPRFPKDFDKRNVHIPFTQAEWPLSEKKRFAAINNFGAAGGNTMMILEEPPRLSEERAEDTRPTHVVAVSAKTKTALTSNIKRLLAHLDDNIGITDLADLAYTTTARKYHHTFRVAATATDIAGIRKQLVATLDSGKIDVMRPVNKQGTHSVAFAFTGQGASLPSTSSELYRDVVSFREHIQHLDAMAQIQGFPSFLPSLDGSHPKDYKHSPVITQVSQVCMQLALTKYWASLGVIPDIVIGHSLGEYAALCTAGVISASEAIFLVGRRAQLLEEKCQQGSHIMMAVRGSLDAIRQALGDRDFCVACINTPNDAVLSGTKTQMDEVATILEAATPSLRCIKLDVAFAFHSEQTDPILEEFEAAAKTVTFHEPTIPIISPLLGKVVFDDHTFNASYLRHATRDTVDFVTALDTAHGMSSIGDDTIWLEMGPHPVCMNFIKTTLPLTSLALPSVRRGENEWKALTDTMSALHLAGVVLDWREFHRPMSHRLRMMDLPTYSWDLKNYWLQYNGDWCLTKGNTYYHDNLTTVKQIEAAPPVYESLNSLVQNIVDVDVDGSTGTVVMQSDLMQKDFLKAANGHRMNDCGVVTSSIHADIAYTLGAYLYKKFFPKGKLPDMDIADLVVTKGLVAQKGSTTTPQVIQVTLHAPDIASGVLDLTWQNVEQGVATLTFATAKLILGSATQWLSSWSPVAHLVHNRIEMLESLALQGKANRFSRNMAYMLFANNLVDYADIYRGMQSVVMHDLEAFADVQLSTEDHGGDHTVPPYFIDSVAHLAGFIMNCTDSSLVDTKKNYCVTSGWQSMRFAEPLVPGAKYRSYVKMIPQAEEGVFLGDVYIMRAEDLVVVGMVGGIVFRKFPRILLNHFFSPPTVSEKTGAAPAAAYKRTPQPKAVKAVEAKPVPVQEKVHHVRQISKLTNPHHVDEVTPPATPPSSAGSAYEEVAPAAPPAAAANANSVAAKALALIAREAALDVADLQDDCELSSLGIDSLMSLVLAEKLRGELKVEINGSLFLDYPTVGDLTAWLSEYYS